MDMCGIGRASALVPDLPRRFTDEFVSEEDAAVPAPDMAQQPPGLLKLVPLKLVGAGWTTLYHAAQMGRIVKGMKADPSIGGWNLLKGLV